MDEKRLINAAINDIWKLIKRYYETRQDDAFWKEVVDSGVAISDKYNHHPLIDDFVRDAVTTYRIYDRINECSIEGGFDTQKWAEAVAEMMEEKYEQDKIRFGNGEVDSRQGTE